MAERVFLLNRFRDEVSRGDHERFVREVDYPTGRSLEGILSFVVTRIDGPLREGESSPFDCIEDVGIESLDAYLAALRSPEIEEISPEWSTYIKESHIVHGEIIE